MEEAQEAVESPPIESAEPAAPKKRARAKLQHPVDRLIGLVTAVERVTDKRLVRRVSIEATDPTGWTMTIDMEDDDLGHPRESMHYDCGEELTAPLYRNAMADLAGILQARAREAEEEYLRCRSAIVRSLPPSERVPATSRKRRIRRGNSKASQAA